uniref:'chromo' domain containing protein n=1 Tax=Solanum tuberosum TaxID=4113 RepID=M1DFE0_SOLTU
MEESCFLGGLKLCSRSCVTFQHTNLDRVPRSGAYMGSGVTSGTLTWIGYHVAVKCLGDFLPIYKVLWFPQPMKSKFYESSFQHINPFVHTTSEWRAILVFARLRKQAGEECDLCLEGLCSSYGDIWMPKRAMSCLWINIDAYKGYDLPTGRY